MLPNKPASPVWQSHDALLFKHPQRLYDKAGATPVADRPFISRFHTAFQEWSSTSPSDTPMFGISIPRYSANAGKSALSHAVTSAWMPFPIHSDYKTIAHPSKPISNLLSSLKLYPRQIIKHLYFFCSLLFCNVCDSIQASLGGKGWF